MLTYVIVPNTVLRYKREDGKYNGRYRRCSLPHFRTAYAESTFKGYNPRGGDSLVPYNYLVR